MRGGDKGEWEGREVIEKRVWRKREGNWERVGDLEEEVEERWGEGGGREGGGREEGREGRFVELWCWVVGDEGVVSK